MLWERFGVHSSSRGKNYTKGTPRRATHLGGQSCQVGSCQRDISGNLNTRANKRLVEKEGIPGHMGKTGSVSLPPLLTTDTCTSSVMTPEPDPVPGTRCVQRVLPSFPCTTDTTALQLRLPSFYARDTKALPKVYPWLTAAQVVQLLSDPSHCSQTISESRG